MSDRERHLFAWGIGIQVVAVLIVWLWWLAQAWVEAMLLAGTA